MIEVQDQFQQVQDATYDKVIARIQAHITAATQAREAAAKQSWELLLQAVSHLKDGAPGHKPGAFTEALSRVSLRSSALAAGLQIPAPRFSEAEGALKVKYPTGEETALRTCHALLDGALGDVRKSQPIIEPKLMVSKANAAFNLYSSADFEGLVKMYVNACTTLKAELPSLASPVPPKPDNRAFRFDS